MAESTGFDIEHAHKYFSVNCFNLTWELIDKPDRTPKDNEQMVRLAQASLWHWTQRPDCTRAKHVDRLLADITHLRTRQTGESVARLRRSLPGGNA